MILSHGVVGVLGMLLERSRGEESPSTDSFSLLSLWLVRASGIGFSAFSVAAVCRIGRWIFVNFDCRVVFLDM